MYEITISHLNNGILYPPPPRNRFAKTHGKYTEEDLDIEISHREPVTFSDKTAFFAVKCVRLAFDTG